MDAFFYPYSTAPPSTTMEPQQGPCPSQGVLSPVNYIYITTSLQTQDGEQDSVHRTSSAPLYSLPALDIHARTFVPGASEHGLEAVLNVHAPEFVPIAQKSSMPSTPRLQQQPQTPYVFEAKQDFDAEALYQQRRGEEMDADRAMLVQGFYFPTSSNRDDYIPSVFTAFRNYEKFPLVKTEYEEQTPEERESTRRSFVQSMHDGDKGIVGDEEEDDSWRTISVPQSDYQWFELAELQSLKCIHHFNVFGRPVLTKSGTAPATTIAILKSTPKHLSVTTPDGLWKSTVMGCAQQLLDPVRYHGRKEVLESLRGSALENACIGQCEKTYSEHGWWVHDCYGPEEYHVMDDPLNPWLYPNPDESVMINGITEGFGHRVDIITAATQEKEKEDAARKAAFNARLRQGRNPSRLGLSCFTHEGVEKVPGFTSGPRTTSPSLRHPACRSARRPTTIAMPVHEPTGPSSEVLATDRYTAGSSLPREEWKRLLAATEDRPVAVRWADDEDEDWEEPSAVIPALPSSMDALGNRETGSTKASAEEEVEDTEDFHDNDDCSVSSSATFTTVEHSQAPSVSPGETPDTSFPVSDNEDGGSETATDEEDDGVCGQQSTESGGPAVSEVDRTGILQTDLVEPASSISTHAGDIHARLEAIEVAMQTAAPPSAPLVRVLPVTPVPVARRIPTSVIHFDAGGNSRVFGTFLCQPCHPSSTDSLQPRSGSRPSLPVIVPTPAGALPSRPRRVVHRYQNGAIITTPPGQQLGLLRSHGVRFDRLPENFGNAPVPRASVAPAKVLSEENISAVETEAISAGAEAAATHEAEELPNVTAAVAQSHSTALVLYPGNAPFDNSMDRYLHAWNWLLTFRSPGEHFWQCAIRRVCVETYLDALALEKSTAVVEVGGHEVNQHSAISARATVRFVDHGAGVEEAIVGNTVQLVVEHTHNIEFDAGVARHISPLITVQEENEPSLAPGATLHPLPAPIGRSRPRHDGRRVRFALPPPRAASMYTVSPDQWPGFNGVHNVPSSLPTPPLSISWALSNEVSRFSWTYPTTLQSRKAVSKERTTATGMKKRSRRPFDLCPACQISSVHARAGSTPAGTRH